jgi:transcriptional regulator with XRE-family HTH domain
MLTSNMNKTLGERIRELREIKDLSLREFATKLDLSAAFVSDIELGRRYPSGKVLGDMAKALGTSVEELQKFDTRAPVDGLKRLASSNPAYGLAFRTIVDKRINPEALLKWAEKRPKDGDEKKR